MQNYVYVETYGCSANQNNSEIIRGLLKQSGYEITNNENIAEILIINTCVVKGKTESKIKRRIQDISKQYKDKILIIAGCMPEIEQNRLKSLNPNLILLGINNIKKIVNLIKDYKENSLDTKKQSEYLSKRSEEKILLPKIPNNKLISITQISEGCLGECTFCNVRFVKGQLYSYDFEKIINSIENDLQSGAKEIWLTCQDCASYNLDKGKNMFPELLKDIINLNHNFKLRLGMMNPNNLYLILDQIIEIYKNPKIYKFLHIPIQSASNKILNHMKRPYNIELVEDIINKFKKEIPNLTIATDIIVGYPTECEEDHKKNLDFIKKFKPDVLNLSKFSSHKQTKAGKLEPLSKEIINKRTSEIMALHRLTAEDNKKKYLEKEIIVFVNKKLEGFFEARDNNYNIVLISSKDKTILGKNVSVKIKQIGAHHLIGEIV